MRIALHSGLSWSKWSPHPIDFENSAGLGGSQVAAARMAHALAVAGHSVALFGDFSVKALSEPPEDPLLTLYPLDAYWKYVAGNQLDLLVVSRYGRFLHFGSNIRRVLLWCHDLSPMGGVEHLREKPNFAVLGLSEWHLRHLRPLIPRPIPLVRCRNGIERSLYARDPWSHIVPHRFIYSSAVYRGLERVLECWPLIRARLPTATLHIYTDFHSPLVKRQMCALGNRLEKAAHRLADHGVTCHGFVGQRQLRDAWYEADMWFYPTTFQETYCITALEAQASGTLCCCTPVAALCETVGDGRGVELPLESAHDVDDDDQGEGGAANAFTYAELLVEIVCNALVERDTREQREHAREWALQQTWDDVVQQWTRDVNRC